MTEMINGRFNIVLLLVYVEEKQSFSTKIFLGQIDVVTHFGNILN